MSDVIRLDDVRDVPDRTLPDIAPPDPDDSWTPISLSQHPDRPADQPTLGGLGIAYPAKRHVFSGPPESAKTIAAYALALHVIRDGGTVVVIDFEMGRWDARNRLRDMGATPHELDSIHYVEPYDSATPARIQALVALRPQLAIIDAAAGAYDIQGLDDNKRGDVEQFTRLYVRDFWKADIATLVIDHVTKNTDSRGRFVIGSERKLGGVDVHLGFDIIAPLSRGGTGRFKIHNHKDRHGYLRRGHILDLTLTSDPDTHRITWQLTEVTVTAPGDTYRYTGLMESISRLLEVAPDPMSGNEVVKGITGGKNEQRLAALQTLVDEEYALRLDGPRGAHLHTSLRPYRQSEDPLSDRYEPEIDVETAGGEVEPKHWLDDPDTADDLSPLQTSIHAETDLSPTSPPTSPQSANDLSPDLPRPKAGRGERLDEQGEEPLPWWAE